MINPPISNMSFIMGRTFAAEVWQVTRWAQPYSRERTKEEELATTSVSYNLPAFASTPLWTVLCCCLAYFFFTPLGIKMSSEDDKLKEKGKTFTWRWEQMSFWCSFGIKYRGTTLFGFSLDQAQCALAFPFLKGKKEGIFSSQIMSKIGCGFYI